MAKINSIIDTFLFYLLSAALAGLVGICLLQVVARYLFSASFTWAEEISVVLLIWATWGAACLATKARYSLECQDPRGKNKQQNKPDFAFMLTFSRYPFSCNHYNSLKAGFG